jgi:hypothetical protein
MKGRRQPVKVRRTEAERPEATAPPLEGVVLVQLAEDAGYPSAVSLGEDPESKELASRLQPILGKFDQDELVKTVHRSKGGLVLVAEIVGDDFVQSDIFNLFRSLIDYNKDELIISGHAALIVDEAALHEPGEVYIKSEYVNIYRFLYRAFRARRMREKQKQDKEQPPHGTRTVQESVARLADETITPPERAEGHFAGSQALLAAARVQFGNELAALAGEAQATNNIKTYSELIINRCEELFSVLREPSGKIVTLRFDESSGQAEMVPLDDHKNAVKLETFPKFEVINIVDLTRDESTVAVGRMQGRRRAEALTFEQRSRGGKATAAQLTPKERKEKASKAGKIRSDSMTPEERKELASKAAKAMHEKRRASKQ